MPLRTGLIGVGRWGRNIVRTLARFPDVELTRVARASAGRPTELPPRTEVTTDWRRIAEARDLDAVLIATPPDKHAEMIVSALGAGLPVFVEKPMVTRVADAERIVQLARERRGCVVVDHIHLFNPAFRELKKRLQAIGPLRSIHTVAGGPGPLREDCSVLWDWGPHDVAMTLDLLGQVPTRVAARRVAGEVPDEPHGESIAIDLQFPSVNLVHLDLSNQRRQKRREYRVTGENGELLFADARPPVLTRRPGAGHAGTPLPFVDEPPLEVALREFFAAVRGKQAPQDSLRLALDVTRILAEAEQQLARA